MSKVLLTRAEANKLKGKHLDIPYGYTEIGTCAFQKRDIVSVNIPDSVTNIGELAFCQCFNLTNVNIPESVVNIDVSAFDSCNGLQNIVLPRNVKNIGERAFQGCGRLTGINIPEGVTRISDLAFYCCHSLTNVIIPDSVMNIGKQAFRDCSSLTSINIPENVTHIDEEAFNFCANLESIDVSENNQCFSSMDGVLFDKNGKTLIRYPAGRKNRFYIMPNGVINIDKYSFWICLNLMDVGLPDGVAHIGEMAFYECKNLAGINLPDSVTNIDEYAFEGCGSITVLCSKNSYAHIYCQQYQKEHKEDQDKNSAYIAAHKYTLPYKQERKNDSICGCFFCMTIFPFEEIKGWADSSVVTCPYCMIDSVIGDSSGYPITAEFLKRMYKYWFRGLKSLNFTIEAWDMS